MTRPIPISDPALEQKDIVAGQRVLRVELTGIAELHDRLDASFSQAVEICFRCKGRIILTGMGKSGHVASKIAATLASTGSPSFFVHPGEASHGDLGMMTRLDVVIALSNSGETQELNDIVAFSRRFTIPLIAITKKPDSTLGQTADVVLTIPDAEEACPMGLAPTTSTTLMLALGDALAVALMDRKAFSAEEFKARHPGGRLGHRLLKVEDIMHALAAVPLVPQDSAMSEALIEMTAKTFGCTGVVDGDGVLLGVVTDGDLRRNMGDDLLGRRAIDIMTPAPQTIGRSALAAEALARMNENKVHCLFVTESGRPVGLIHIHDCIRAGV